MTTKTVAQPANDLDIKGYRLLVYRDEDDSWAAEVPDLPGCIAAAATPREAIDLAGDAIEAWIEAAIADERAVPPPSRSVDDEFSGRFVVRVPKSLHRRLVDAARAEGVSLNTLCGMALTEAVVDGQAWTKATTFSNPLAAVPRASVQTVRIDARKWHDWDVDLIKLLRESIQTGEAQTDRRSTHGMTYFWMDSNVKLIQSLDSATSLPTNDSVEVRPVGYNVVQVPSGRLVPLPAEGDQRAGSKTLSRQRVLQPAS